jgi:hypothetical protein
MNLTRLNYPQGWVSSEDAINGNPEALLRMDNLQQEEDGSLSLVRGYKQIATFSDYVDKIYSVSLGTKNPVYVSLNLTSSQVLRSLTGDFSDSTTILTNGGRPAVFGSALGEVFIVAGSHSYNKTKDNGSTLRALGIIAGDGSAITAVVHNQPVLDLTNPGTWSALEGANFTPGSPLTSVDTVSVAGTYIYRANLRFTFTYPKDTTQFSQGIAEDPSKDIFSLTIKLSDSEAFSYIRLEFVLDNDLTNIQNYYATEVFRHDTGDVTFNLGLNQQSVITVKRGDFQRFGTDSTLDWKHVTAINVVGVSSSASPSGTMYVGLQQFIGGPAGQLNGQYQYGYQLIADNGVYQAKSPFVYNKKVYNLINGSTTVTMDGLVDPQVNQVWIYRRSVESGNQNLLPTWYRVATINAATGTVDDVLSDNDAIELNIQPNLYLQSTGLIHDYFIGIEGLFNERMIYLTLSNVYLSDRLNPDAIDTRYTLRVSGDPTEKNLWIKKISNNLIVLATTKDLYEISGTLLDLPDGSLDVNIIPIGEKYPPLSQDHAAIAGGIFYVAADGLRLTTGSNSQLVSPQLRLLFEGLGRHGVPAISVLTGDNARYCMAIGKTKLFVAVPMVDGTRRLLVYDLVNKTFRLQFTDPFTLFVTPSDRVLAGYSDPGTGLWELESGSGVQTLSSGTQGLPITFMTVYDCNGQPRNRKDTFTLKIIADTGGDPVSVFIAKDGGGYQAVGTVQTSGLATTYFPLNNFTLGFRYSLKIVDQHGLTNFHLYETTIEYEPRPEQLDYLRILPTNLGSYSRKRVTSYAFVIDTLGNDITFTPYLDNVVWRSVGRVHTDTKLTYIFYFTSEAVCTDIGGILCGGVFEFYGLNLEETVSEKLPTPCKFLVIPPNNYGTPNRKRHTSYKFQILTRGKNVLFTPILDGVAHQTAIFNTSIKQTVEYFFPQSDGDVIGFDIGGTLKSLENVAFEFYGVVTPQEVETLPARLEYFRIPNSDFGVSAQKRFRTIPLIIDTYGRNVIFTPIIDGNASYPQSTLVSTGKRTVYHYFVNDVFGVDIGGILQCSDGPFEFYGLGQPENVETLPVPKKYDQLGPLRFDKIGKIFGFRVRMIINGSTVLIPYGFYGDDSPSDPTYASLLYSGTFPVRPQIDNVYEIQLPKNINSDIVRLVLGPTNDSFHRYDVMVKVATSGMESESRWIPIR